MRRRHSSSETLPSAPGNATETSKYKAPDGGWGWVVCFACFMTHLLIDGVTYSFGVVFVELLDYYKGTNAGTAWIIALSTSMCFLSGPVVAALTKQFGCRIIAAAGTLLTSASLILSMFSPDLYFLYFSFGILFGFGYGMTFLPTIVCVSEYFEKRRALATGLGVCGSGIGTFIFSPLTAVLIEAYAWRGAILIQAGLILNCLACSLVYRPLKLKRNFDQDEREKFLIKPSCDTLERTSCSNKSLRDQADSKIAKETNHPERNDKIICMTEVGEAKKCSVNDDTKVSNEITSTDFVKHQHNPNTDTLCSNFLTTTYNSFRESFSPHQFKNKAFTLFAISTYFYSLGYYIPYVYLPVRSRDAGVEDIKAAWILSAVGISNTVGRVVFGFLSDRKWVNRLYLYNTALVICGIGTSLGQFLSSFASLLIYALVFGLFSGVTISLTSVLITDIVGIENLSHAFGMVNFVAGIGILVGPPIGGWLFDISGNYSGSFVFAGCTIAFSGIILFAIPCIDKKWNKRRLEMTREPQLDSPTIGTPRRNVANTGIA